MYCKDFVIMDYCSFLAPFSSSFTTASCPFPAAYDSGVRPQEFNWVGSPGVILRAPFSDTLNKLYLVT
jgi:hypothetical protein